MLLGQEQGVNTVSTRPQAYRSSIAHTRTLNSEHGREEAIIGSVAAPLSILLKRTTKDYRRGLLN